jgi:hypothetical protein
LEKWPRFARPLPWAMAQTEQDREQNKRTALVLASIALVFFLGIVAKYLLFS